MSVSNIRKGIFETNSSSVHVLCINKVYNKEIPKEFIFNPNIKAGWENDTICSSYMLGSYLYRILLDYSEDLGTKEFIRSDTYKEIEAKYTNCDHNLCKEYNKILQDYYLEYSMKYEYDFKEKIENILREYGCTDIKWEPVEYDMYGSVVGYIDHVDDAFDFLDQMIKCPPLLINYLFGDSIIYTGNDNYPDFAPIGDPNADYTYIKGN